jgi:anti-sigma factor RsiW
MVKSFWNKIKFQSFNNMEGQKMKCSGIRKMISPYVDDELSPNDKRAFTAHIRECVACKKELADIQSVHELFVSAENYSAPSGFATRVMANLEEMEETGYSRLWRFLTVKPFFLRTVEITFALIVVMIGAISGNLLVRDRITPQKPLTVQESFSLDLFQATPPDSIGGVYVKLMGATDEK